MPELLQSAITGFSAPRQGKVRDVYDLGENILIVATDRISAFDCVMPNGIPDKGSILTEISANWFNRLSAICPHHLLSVDFIVVSQVLPGPYPELARRSTLAKKAKTLPVECVARGYLTGSLFKEYRENGGTVHGLDLPDGLQDGDALPEPIFTPATKAEEGHDKNISFSAVVELLGHETATYIKEKTLELYTSAAEIVKPYGLILCDTKFEFGETKDGILWIDEALTPDSSRYWDVSGYAPGKAQPSYDKQFVRDYLETLDWNKQPPAPLLPPEIVTKTREKYLRAYELVVGQPF